MIKKNIGSSFDESLAENAALDGVSAVAEKRVIEWKIEQDRAGECGGGDWNEGGVVGRLNHM